MYPNAHSALADKAQSKLLANIFSLSPCTTYYIVVGIWALRNSSRGTFQTRNLSKHKTDFLAWKRQFGIQKDVFQKIQIVCEICLTEY